ncbi:pseudaminic acid biosynthesis-associated methylase [Hymenobacter nivis]|uniref:Methyltransferase type 11 n=1 Tax=Hymenobacter nivis TaxID=1850093 RepID=A0A2Z3GM36_9BACT|nr:pseudaminic acid biosynthesis-associated methylase [Hymenobacter nivis]AWM35299.1 methyltransferase type 11 [Hymenobacter nivis]
MTSNPNTKQEHFWTSDFGRHYTDRNSRHLADWNQFYLDNWGQTKLAMNERFLGHLSREARIMEVGCNTGMQLMGLQENGFKNLYGVEIQPYAVEKAKEYTQHVNIVQGSGLDLPFKDDFFDVVGTNGVLIHISPDDLPKVMAEMMRCTSRYIWGFEYYMPDITTIKYRDNVGYAWKGDYARLFMEQFPGQLRVVQQEFFPYVNPAEQGNTDCMYLLEKIGA